MTTLYSISPDPRGTQLINSDNEVVYEVKTSQGVSSIMRKNDGGKQEFHPIGEISWNHPATFSKSSPRRISSRTHNIIAELGNAEPVLSSQFLRVHQSDSKFKRFMKMAEELQ
jgi:hypothetical protein